MIVVESSDSDLETLCSGVGDQSQVIQALKRTIRRQQSKINKLADKLTIANNYLASEKEKTKDKDDVIKSLKMSIDVITQSKDLIILTLQNQMQTSLGLSKCESVTKDSPEQNPKQTESAETAFSNLNPDIEALKVKLAQKNEKLFDEMKKYEWFVREHIFKLKDPPIFSRLPRGGCIASIFQTISSAGPGWRIIQRRTEGRVAFETRGHNLDCFNGFGDLCGEFWLGCDKIHKLTTNRRHELYIELIDFDGVNTFARYDHFVVGGKAEEYKLKSLGRYSGNAVDFIRKVKNNKHLVSLDSRILTFFGYWSSDENLIENYFDCNASFFIDGGILWDRCNLGKRHSLKSCKMAIRPTK